MNCQSPNHTAPFTPMTAGRAGSSHMTILLSSIARPKMKLVAGTHSSPLPDQLRYALLLILHSWNHGRAGIVAEVSPVMDDLLVLYRDPSPKALCTDPKSLPPMKEDTKHDKRDITVCDEEQNQELIYLDKLQNAQMLYSTTRRVTGIAKSSRFGRRAGKASHVIITREALVSPLTY